MTFKLFIKKLLCRACCYFTLCMLGYIAVAAIVNVDDDRLLLEAGRTVLFFVFALLVSFATSLLSLDKPSKKLLGVLHYVITLFAFYTCFMLPLSMRASGILVGLVIYTLVYLATVGAIVLFKSRYRKNTENSQKYEKQYSSKRK